MSLSILHINSNLISTSLYYNLFRELSSIGVSQNVWVPHKKYHKPGIPENIENVKYFFNGYQDVFDRVLFHRKIIKGMERFDFSSNCSSNSVIHAHTLFSDGALAYEINRKYGNPYIVTVRNTDLNLFWKYFPHLHNYARQVVKNASAVTFLGDSYKDRMVQSLFAGNCDKYEDRVHVIPNGIDPYWSSHPPKRQKVSEAEIKVLFVGGFIKLKNIKTLVEACAILKKNGENLSLRLIGAKNATDFAYSDAYNWIDTLPFCDSKAELAEHYRWADVFAMPSLTETFGLVYAEALSQGTPVIFTKGQGFDGWVKEGMCGYGVPPKDAQRIAQCIKTLRQQSDEGECMKSSLIFGWPAIVADYLKIYQNAIKN